jgi:serine/threonine protein kinase
VYVATEFIDGQTLSQWMIDNPRPDLETVRGLVEQIAKGLRAFHRLEMLHQDLRPENIMIDKTGTAKIIDFGATRVAGLVEADARRAGGSSARSSIRRRSIFWARAARRAPTCFRSASSPTRC